MENMRDYVDTLEASGEKMTAEAWRAWIDHEQTDFSAQDERFSKISPSDIDRIIETLETDGYVISEAREMEIAAAMSEMIALGWSMESFDRDFDNCDSADWTPEEKETCRRIFKYLWEDRKDGNETQDDNKKVSRRIELWYWIDGSGYTHNETFENTQEDITAADWIAGLDEPFEIDEGEGIEVRIFDNETNELLSHQWM